MLFEQPTPQEDTSGKSSRRWITAVTLSCPSCGHVTLVDLLHGQGKWKLPPPQFH